jgi:GxxExxY protein
MPVVYEGISLEAGFRADIVVANELILEIKAVDGLLPIHAAQVLTYLRMSGYHIGLLLNFNSLRLKDGIRRFVM